MEKNRTLDLGKKVNSVEGTLVQGGPERSRQSNLAVFTVEGGLDSTFPCVK